MSPHSSPASADARSPAGSSAAAQLNLHGLSVNQILESAPDAMLISGPDGKIVYANSLSTALFGYERDELLGQPIELLVPPETRTLHGEHRRGYFEHPRARMMETGLELYGLRKDGSRFPLEISLSPLRTSAGILVLGAVRDRTRKQKAEEEIRALNKNLEGKIRELDAANSELQELTYTTAHDLRAPVRHMQGYAELLKQTAANRLRKPELEQLEKISSSAKRLGLLIDGLLDFSRLGRLALNLQPVNLDPLVEDIQAELLKTVSPRRVAWRKGCLPTVRADAGALRALFTNLFENALKFTRPRQEAVIEIGCHRGNGTITIFVRDNGVGFDMQYAGKLFQISQRLHRHDEFEGTGIGLAAVRRIAERHGWSVWAKSQPGKGATFYLSIPEGDQTDGQ